jgi:hypothetical protein
MGLGSRVNDDDVVLPHVVQVTFSELEIATQQFSRTMRIGGGGSCDVFRGVINRVEVAVKVLKQDQGNTTNEDNVSDSTLCLDAKQFVAEMCLLQAVHHPNICRLLAVSMNGPHRW